MSYYSLRMGSASFVVVSAGSPSPAYKLMRIPGDDERVRIYDTDTLKCEKTVHSDKWGQVTALSWIYVDHPVEEKSISLCVGSGRGFVTMCPLFKDDKVCRSISQNLSLLTIDDPAFTLEGGTNVSGVHIQ
jgi:hypothetical protein